MEEFHYKKKRPDISQYYEKETLEAWNKFNELAFKESTLSRKIKELIAVACAHITRCPYCITNHTRKALSCGATKQEIAEALVIAAAMNAGASFAHGFIGLED